MDSKGNEETEALRDLRGRKDLPVLRDPRDHGDPMVSLVPRENGDQQDKQEILVIQDKPDKMDAQVKSYV